MTNLVSRKLALGVAAALVLSFLAFLIASSTGGAIATHAPADKVVASGDTGDVEVINSGDEVSLLSGHVRSSAPSDLILSVTAECAITTNIKTVGDDDATAQGNVEVWVEIDGERVGINNIGTSTTTAEAQDDGEVVFCNRAFRRKTSGFDPDESDATIETFLDTRQSNAFNWVALNVGRGTHDIEVKARLTQEATNGTAKAAVGNRSLVIEPAKLANDASI